MSKTSTATAAPLNLARPENQPTIVKKPRVKNPNPIATSIEVASKDEASAIVSRSSHRTELSKRLDQLEVNGDALKVQGDFPRVRNAVFAFGQKSQRKFTVGRNAEGVIFIARVPKPIKDKSAA